MGTLGNPKVWMPYMSSKECTQEICSLSCPQWCYIIFPPPPPPPPPFSFPDDTSQNTHTFSPLVIAIIGILASTFLLASYYVIISKYCGKNESIRGHLDRPTTEETLDTNEVNNDYSDLNPSQENHDPWFVSTHGLDEALIKTITLVKYKKSDGLILGGDCSVCLGEFLDDDSLRLLPKCSHAFHVVCIDTWLKSHSNCPLCRATIFAIVQPRQPTQPPLTLAIESNNNSSYNLQVQDHGSSSETHVVNLGISLIGEGGGNLVKNPFRTYSDVGRSGLNGGGYEEEMKVRRSVSMDHCSEMKVSVSSIVGLQGEEGCCGEENCEFRVDEGMKIGAGESSKCGLGDASGKNGVLHSVLSSNRSSSSGRFLFSKHCRGSRTVTPV